MQPVQVARDQYVEIHDYNWSPDGRWLAYDITGDNTQSGIYLYNLETRKATLVSDVHANDFQPVFDSAGKYLFFISTDAARESQHSVADLELNIATLKMTGIYVATLKRGAPSPFAPRSDEGVTDKDAADKDKDDEQDKKEGKKGEQQGAPEVKPRRHRPRWLDGARGAVADPALRHEHRLLQLARSGAYRQECST